jgi:transcriptional regulator with XRE-family HTH domain
VPQARTLDPTASSAACLGALLRHLRTLHGLTQAGLGRLAGFDGSYVGAVERAAVRPSRDLVERCDRALGAGGVLLALWPPADRQWQPRPTAASRPTEDRAAVPGQPGGRAAGDPPGRGTRHPPGRAGPAAPDPEAEAVVEAMEVARRVEACDVGPGTLAAIERAVERLATAGVGRPPELLIPAVRARRRYVERLLEERVTLGRRYVERLLEERVTLGRRRRLLVVAGRLSLELARLHFDAGEREAAEANRDAAVRLARQAGDAELAAGGVEALACWALADGRFRDALELARAGQDLAPPASAAAVQLALDEAQAWTFIGDHDQAAGARRLAALTRAMLPKAVAS